MAGLSRRSLFAGMAALPALAAARPVPAGGVSPYLGMSVLVEEVHVVCSAPASELAQSNLRALMSASEEMLRACTPGRYASADDAADDHRAFGWQG